MGANEAGGAGVARPVWRAVGIATLVATWALMVMGALTRASQAGVSCPDWPLCHGYLVPPLDQAAYPADPLYQVHKVYLEFVHRALAGLVSAGAVIVAWRAWLARRRGHSLLVLGMLAAQIAMGAATVFLKNAPYTVVLHLALALGFLGALVATHRRVLSAPYRGVEAPGSGAGAAAVLALLVAQMLVGSAVSSGYFALACPDFPFCEGGALWPSAWTEGLAWQMAHRALGVVVLIAALGMAARALRSGHDRALWLLVSLGILAQGLLGGLNVWLRVPPWASAAHLALAAVLFGALAMRLARRPATKVAPERTPALDRAA